MSIFTILTLIFLVLKLTHYIDWSWWLVLMPTLIHIALWLITVIRYATMSEQERYMAAFKRKYKS